ncbi:N4-gp56 family major capsid protein [Bartonella sp. HY406]|uniref:N4-gp56 family major capsid protein n=1 Tax=Bartonella sp. HY406 TaxID=2979331 RepID=UPI0021C86589|nr:N4-gp56 family major capsid protein [Bartonella sp. HY406]UXN03124.1 N4-gp56 family major capsid protein [Bartonella sp. HY406]
MAVTNIDVNNPLAVKTWSRQLAAEISKATAIAPLIGTSSSSIIQLKDETTKGAGDKVTFGLRRQLIGDGVTEGTELEGREEALSTYSDSLMLNELAHAVRVKNDGTIDAQRVPFNLREEANAGLVDWYADRLSMTAFLHLCGYTGKTLNFEGNSLTLSSVHYGFNQPTAPTVNRVFRANNKANEAALAVADSFNLSLIDRAVEKAKLANPKIRPVRMNGENVYVLYLHPTQVTSLRTNTSAGQWLDIQKAAYMGSRAKNPIFDGSLGMYNGVILREAEHIMPGLSDTGVELPNVRRAVLLGGQAGVIAFGKDRSAEKYKLVEELFDYQRELGVAAKTVFGFKKTVFNNEDFGSIVISTYAAPA